MRDTSANELLMTHRNPSDGLHTRCDLDVSRVSSGRSDFAARDNAWLRLFASKTAPSIARWAASWRSHQSRGPQSSGHAKHHQRHIIKTRNVTVPESDAGLR